MYRVKETIIVEGVYDKIKLSGFIDSMIFTTQGFAIFNNKHAQQSVKTLAEKNGIVILTDSDAAGIKIRNFVKQLVPAEKVKHAYIPEISGKERRKTKFSKEGFLGVEGISDEIILNALKKSGCTIDGTPDKIKNSKKVTKTDFFRLGLTGGENSAETRKKLALALGLPSKLSANMLLDAVNQMITPEELSKLLENI